MTFNSFSFIGGKILKRLHIYLYLIYILSLILFVIYVIYNTFLDAALSTERNNRGDAILSRVKPARNSAFR